MHGAGTCRHAEHTEQRKEPSEDARDHMYHQRELAQAGRGPMTEPLLAASGQELAATALVSDSGAPI